MKKFFTLIELIVVIAVLGILAAIIVPNIQNVKEKATNSAIIADIATTQLAVDMYSQEHYGGLPTKINPTIQQPQPIDFEELDNRYLKTFTKHKNLNWSIDYTGRVYASTVTELHVLSSTNNELVIEAMDGAERYNIYSANLNGKGLKKEKSISPTGEEINLVSMLSNFLMDVAYAESTNKELVIPVKDTTNKMYLVSAVDQKGFETAPYGLSNQGQNPNPNEPEEPEEPVVSKEISFETDEKNTDHFEQTFVIPNLKKITKITSDMGTVSVVNTEGDQVTVSVANGDSVRQVQTGGEYIPDQDKFVTVFYEYKVTVGNYICENNQWSSIAGGSGLTSTKNYSDADGFTGKIARGDFIKYDEKVIYFDNRYYPCVDGTFDPTLKYEYADGGHNYSGTVVKKGSDTRTYDKYYKYQIKIEYEE